MKITARARIKYCGIEVELYANKNLADLAAGANMIDSLGTLIVDLAQYSALVEHLRNGGIEVTIEEDQK